MPAGGLPGAPDLRRQSFAGGHIVAQRTKSRRGVRGIPVGMLAQTFWRANRFIQGHILTFGNTRFYSRLRIVVILGRMPLRARTLVCSRWSVRRWHRQEPRQH